MPARPAPTGALPPHSAVPLPSTAHLPQSSSSVPGTSTGGGAATAAAAQQDALSVILVTGGYDNTIRFWEAWSGVCSRTLNHQEHVRSITLSFPFPLSPPNSTPSAATGADRER